MENAEFKRKSSTYRSMVSEESPRFKPEAGRYHLYVALACPWAHRCLITLHMKGLADAIGVSICHPTWMKTKEHDPADPHWGWGFAPENAKPWVPHCGVGSIGSEGCIPDTVNGARSVRDLYELQNDTSGKYTVPILWDKHERCIVNNESSEIIQMFNTAFNPVAANPTLDLQPPSTVQVAEEVNSWIYEDINNGVYCCGFARSQEAYDKAVTRLFDSLDRAEKILSQQRYITGDFLTLADIRLFTTLVRFDEVYVVYFKCNKKRIADYPNLHNYLRELYQIPEFAATTNMDHIKNHYYTSHPRLNTSAIVPIGSGVIEDLKQPHNRGGNSEKESA
ncbi:unnamed protein product [Chrysoparadoxa australica]